MGSSPSDLLPDVIFERSSFKYSHLPSPLRLVGALETSRGVYHRSWPTWPPTFLPLLAFLGIADGRSLTLPPPPFADSSKCDRTSISCFCFHFKFSLNPSPARRISELEVVRQSSPCPFYLAPSFPQSRLRPRPVFPAFTI